MDNEKIKWYETNIDDYLFNTIYKPDSLTEFVPKDKWFKMNPCRGTREGLLDYDMSYNKDNILAGILKDAYGEKEVCRNIVDNHTYIFNRRLVACGGALYPNIVYVVADVDDRKDIYQYIPALHVLRLIKSKKSIQDMESKVIFVYTDYYWRNWPKYKYFGYRLMQVDTGYALANLSLILSNMEVRHELKISDDYNKKMNDLLDINCKYEAVEGVIETDDYRIINVFSGLKHSENTFEVVDDWDTEPISLYNILEKKLMSEDYNLSQSVIPKEGFEYIKNQYRISPGGGLMISQKKLDYSMFDSFIKQIESLRGMFDKINAGVHIFVYINNVEGLKNGVYMIDGRELIMIKCHDNDTEKYLDSLLRRKNFNLQEIPVLFFVGEKKNEVLRKDNVNCFKNANIKAGFISQLITYAMCREKMWTHPILGYEADIAEKIIGKEDICILNFIPASDVKPLDREFVGL